MEPRSSKPSPAPSEITSPHRVLHPKISLHPKIPNTITPRTPTRCSPNASHNLASAPFARDTSRRCGSMDAIMGKWAYNCDELVSPRATNTVLIRVGCSRRISDSRCWVVGLKPMVRKEVRGGGSRKRGCWSSRLKRFPFRWLEGRDCGRWDASGERRLS